MDTIDTVFLERNFRWVLFFIFFIFFYTLPLFSRRCKSALEQPNYHRARYFSRLRMICSLLGRDTALHRWNRFIIVLRILHLLFDSDTAIFMYVKETETGACYEVP